MPVASPSADSGRINGHHSTEVPPKRPDSRRFGRHLASYLDGQSLDRTGLPEHEEIVTIGGVINKTCDRYLSSPCDSAMCF